MLDGLLADQAKQVQKVSPRPRAKNRLAGLRTTSEWRCCLCGETFRTLAACERHPHRRIACILR